MTKHTTTTPDTIGTTAVPDGMADEAMSIVKSLTAATTPAQYLAVIGQAQHATDVLTARTLDATLFVMRSAGAALAGAYRTTVLATGETPEDRPSWATVSKVLGITRDGSVHGRGYSTLSRDYDAHLFTSGDQHRSAWSAYLATPTGRDDKSVQGAKGYVTFARRAVTGAKGNRALGKDAAVKLAKLRAEEAATARADRERKADQARTDVLSHVAAHPLANLVTGVDLTCGLVMALDMAKLSELIDALTIVHAERTAVAKASKGKGKGTPDPVSEDEDEDEVDEVTAEHVAEGTADVEDIVRTLMAVIEARKA